jgi:hypothetical protein
MSLKTADVEKYPDRLPAYLLEEPSPCLQNCHTVASLSVVCAPHGLAKVRLSAVRLPPLSPAPGKVRTNVTPSTRLLQKGCGKSLFPRRVYFKPSQFIPGLELGTLHAEC